MNIVTQPTVAEVRESIEKMDMKGQFNALINYFDRPEQIDLMVKFQAATRIECAEARQQAQAAVVVTMWVWA